jgi:hypothetical protein
MKLVVLSLLALVMLIAGGAFIVNKFTGDTSSAKDAAVAAPPFAHSPSGAAGANMAPPANVPAQPRISPAGPPAATADHGGGPPLMQHNP